MCISKRLLIILFFTILNSVVFAQNTDSTVLVNGIHRANYSDGAIKERGKYWHEQKQGVWYYYSENGVVKKKEKYKNGVLQWQLFFDKGKIIQTIDKNGKVVNRPNCGC